MVASGERQVRMLVVHSRLANGSDAAMAPADLSAEEVGVEAAAVVEISDWKTVSEKLAVSQVPFRLVPVLLLPRASRSLARLAVVHLRAPSLQREYLQPLGHDR
jgi:hypothetical protein